MYAVEVKAKAEAEQMAKKADAWKEYQEAALVDMMLKVLHIFRSQTLLATSKSLGAAFRCRGGEHSPVQVQEDSDGLWRRRSCWSQSGGHIQIQIQIQSQIQKQMQIQIQIQMKIIGTNSFWPPFQITGEVLEIMNSLPAMVKGMTGVDITQRSSS